MSNEIGLYLGYWFEVHMSKPHELYDLLRDPNVIAKAEKKYVIDIEDDETLSPMMSEYSAQFGSHVLCLRPTDDTGKTVEMMGIDGFVDACNGPPIRRPFGRGAIVLDQHHRGSVILTCIEAHPDVKNWYILHGLCPIIEE